MILSATTTVNQFQMDPHVMWSCIGKINKVLRLCTTQFCSAGWTIAQKHNNAFTAKHYKSEPRKLGRLSSVTALSLVSVGIFHALSAVRLHVN